MSTSQDPPAQEPPAPSLPSPSPAFQSTGSWSRLNRSTSLQLTLSLLLTVVALALGWKPFALLASAVLLGLSLLQLLPPLLRELSGRFHDPPTERVLALLGVVLAAVAFPLALGWLDPILAIYRRADWQAIGALGEGVIGAFGQILVATVALMIAWRQVMIDQRLTSQQNRITQAQTIDNFIHGISQLISDDEGLLEDWPLERMLAEGRLAAVISSIDADGKARILRFLSHAGLLTPLRRDHRLGRAILDGQGGYEEDRLTGVPVIRLQSMLRGVDLSGTDLRGVDFNTADLRGCSFARADLSDANLAGAHLGGADLAGAILDGTRFFFGRAQTATPAEPGVTADLVTGAGSGAVVENANFSGAHLLEAQARYYLAAWSGSRSRPTLPGGCKGVPNQLERRAGA